MPTGIYNRSASKAVQAYHQRLRKQAKNVPAKKLASSIAGANRSEYQRKWRAKQKAKQARAAKAATNCRLFDIVERNLPVQDAGANTLNKWVEVEAGEPTYSDGTTSWPWSQLRVYL